MNLQEFFELLVPPGVIVVAKMVDATAPDGRAFKTFAHTPSHLHSSAASAAFEMAKQKHNVYFALASYKQGFHQNDKGKKVIRVRENVDQLKALWFDIDFKGNYPDAKTAILALRIFSQSTGLPPPAMLVGSGNGLHTYWPLTAPVPLERWQRLADALKAAAKDKGLDADLACTADACRVLRPPGTLNWKDPANPKPVKLLYSSGKTYEPDDLEAALMPWATARKIPSTSVNAELSGGLQIKDQRPASFATIIKHCGVARTIAETHGKDCVEPIWMSTLQLLKHCEDAELWVHAVSDGHPGYDSASTQAKFEARKANSAGPTRCTTFGDYYPEACGKCPHRGYVASPIQLGYEETQIIDGLPMGWRIAEDKKGIERLMVIDPAQKLMEWQKVLKHIPSNVRATRSIITGQYDISFTVEVFGSKPWRVEFPGAFFGNSRKLSEELSSKGMFLKEKEGPAFHALMTSWLNKLQTSRRVADVTDQLGWMITDDKVEGFSCGPNTFYSDGRVRNDVRVSREFSAIAKAYEPRGSLDPWKRVANFLAEQNIPALTAVLAAGFGAPLLKFTGHSGAILSIVSTASGVGKSSALRCSQSIWGSPTEGINAVDDTHKSVARKLGFLNNLPAYWDELRGRETVEGFLQLAFQVTQGKEKSRLDSSANLRDTQTWETMLVVASNESIFEAMGRKMGGSNAGVMRTYEIFIEPFAIERNRAEIAIMFESLNTNYGHAGRIYAQYLASNAVAVREEVESTFKRLATIQTMTAAERFWFAIVSILMVGARIAADLDLVKIDRKTLGKFLLQNIDRLRGRAVDTMDATRPLEILAAFMQTHQDKALFVSKFSSLKQNLSGYSAVITKGAPRADKVAYQVSEEEKRVRIPLTDFSHWLETRNLPTFAIIKEMTMALSGEIKRVKLALGTKWELPQQRCLEFALDATVLKSVGPSRLDESPGSDAPT